MSQREGVGCLSTLSYGETETDVLQVNGLVLPPALSSVPAVGFQGIFSIIYSNDSALQYISRKQKFTTE